MTKTIILAGGLGTRFSEETINKPKPMILINGKPILWHIMDIYASQGYKEFIIATGYMSEIIESWVANLNEDWKVQTINTGLHTQTGGRIKRCIEQFNDKNFFITYGDGLGNVNLASLVDFHRKNGSTLTCTAVRPPARFGYLEINDGRVTKFGEKNQLNEGWINGGFFYANRQVVNSILGDEEPFEIGALPKLTMTGEFFAYKHEGFWFPMDTRSEHKALVNYAKEDVPPWKSF